jgi:autotransporter-associated beta strand protein
VNGLAGTWLLDPYDITIAAGAGAGDITPGASGGGRLFESSATNSRVNVTTISTELVGANVEIATGAGGAGGGNITWDAGAPIDYSSSANSLTLDAHGYIYLKSDIETGSGGLILEADSGYVQADGITLTLNGPLDIETGDTTIGTTGFASPQFAATLVGSQNLTKSGNGRLILSGNSNTWSGTANVQGGTLRVSGNNALGTGTSTNVLSGATLEIDGGIIIGENIELRSGSTLLNWSGNNTITLPVLLRDNGSRVIEIRQGNLTLNPSAGNAISADNNVVADLTLAGSGDLLVQGIVDLDNGQVPATYGDLSQTGTGVARFKDSIIADQVESTGGGTIWMDQPGGLSVALPSTTSISLNNGSVLRRDSSETVTGINLSLGAGGGGISVGNGFTLDWNSAIAGAGTFTKAGDGTLRFASTANISYSGSTFVNGGRLDVFSSLPTTATCSGTGSSNLCGSTPTINSNSDVTGQENTPSERLIALDGLGVVPVLQLVKRDGSQVSDAFEGSSVPYAQVISGEASNGSKSIAVDFGTTSVEAVASSEAQAPTLATGPVQTVLPEQQAGLQLQGSDAQATLRAVAALGLDESLDGVVPGSPSVGNIQQTLVEVQQQAQSGLAFVPAVLRVNFTEAQSGFLDLTLVPPKGAVQARRIEVSRARFASLLKDLYRQLSRQELLDVGNPQSPSRQLHQLLIAPMQESLDAAGITTLLIAADQGLQAVPFSALSDGESYFGNRYGFALSPSLALTDLSASTQTRGLLAMGASEFETLSPLPLVPQELSNIRDSGNTDRYLNEGFTPRSFLDRAADPRYSRVHLASHADFRPGGPAKSLLYTGEGPMSMADFAQLRRQRRDLPLDLVVLSACRTMLGDKDSELGFAGLALQAGARSAIGTLWYVDDVVTSAFFVQFYRFLSQGVPKAEALQRTRQAFALGSVSLKGDQVIGAGGEALLQDLDQSQRRRIAAGVDNPFFWAGIELIGSPW